MTERLFDGASADTPADTAPAHRERPIATDGRAIPIGGPYDSWPLVQRLPLLDAMRARGETIAGHDEWAARRIVRAYLTGVDREELTRQVAAALGEPVLSVLSVARLNAIVGRTVEMLTPEAIR